MFAKVTGWLSQASSRKPLSHNPPALLPRLALIYAPASALVLLPCYWLSRIQAGDLASHIYNAWLAQLVESGRTNGLVVARQTTNVLFDLVLSGLFRLFGAGAAQRISVCAAVLIFIWGAFAFTSAVSGRRTWSLLPLIAMLAYGWVYHMGFFNFYLSLGLCFWAMALGWELRPRRLAAAGALLGVAYVAHALPVAWSVCLLAYYAVTRNAAPRTRGLLTAAVLAAMLIVRVTVAAFFVTRWSPAQITSITGADQVWVFDEKYYFVLIGLLFVWAALLVNMIHNRGVSGVLSSIPLQFVIFTAGGILILPSGVLLPGFSAALTFIAERMSLATGVCVCAFLGAARPRAFERATITAVACAFFVFVYVDERALNRIEDRMESAVATVRSGQRVVSLLSDPQRVNDLTHMIDRVCLGRCYSYANYEPSTQAFRVRAVADNPFVVRSYRDSWALQNGVYTVKQADMPLRALDLDSGGRMVVRELKAGSLCGSTSSEALRKLIPST